MSTSNPLQRLLMSMTEQQPRPVDMLCYPAMSPDCVTLLCYPAMLPIGGIAAAYAVHG